MKKNRFLYFIRAAVLGLLFLASCADGIYFGDDNSLYIASFIRNKIVVLNPHTGDILHEWGKADCQVKGPDDLVLGPDRSIFWTSPVSGNVFRRTPEGQISSQHVKRGVNPITISDEGRLFTAIFSPYLSDGLYELDPDLVKPPRLICSEPGWLNGMDFGPDQRLYAPSFRHETIVRIHVDSGEMETVLEGIRRPTAVKFDSQGALYVTTFSPGIVYKVDVADGSRILVAELARGLDNLAFDAKDRLFVSNALTGDIVEVLSKDATRLVRRVR